VDLALFETPSLTRIEFGETIKWPNEVLRTQISCRLTVISHSRPWNRLKLRVQPSSPYSEKKLERNLQGARAADLVERTEAAEGAV
jgi:hypothetical protein